MKSHTMVFELAELDIDFATFLEELEDMTPRLVMSREQWIELGRPVILWATVPGGD